MVSPPQSRHIFKSPSLNGSSSTINSSEGGWSGSSWLAAYFVCNLTLTLYNKAVMQFIGFKYPWTLTAIHTLCCAIGCYAYNSYSPTPVVGGKKSQVEGKERVVLLAFSLLYTLNIAVSNLSLNLVTVPFHQVVRATTPIFTILISVLFMRKSFALATYLSLVPVIVGVGAATYGDYSYTATGFLLTLLGTVLAAVKTIVTNVVQVGSLKMHPMDLLMRMSPLAFVQCLVYGWLSGELVQVVEYAQTRMTTRHFWALLMNGVLAFALNVVSFTANKKTSALTMTVAGNVKQVLSIVLAIVIFKLSINTTNAFGIVLTLAGGAWYTYLETMRKIKTSPVSDLPVSRSNDDIQLLISSNADPSKHVS